MLVINYNFGSNSRTIFANEVISLNQPRVFTSLLSEEEKLNPLVPIQEFFHNNYPIPESRHLLHLICLRATVKGVVQDEKSKDEMLIFSKHFKKLMEASFWVTKKDPTSFTVKVIKKDNLIPKHVLDRSRRVRNIQAYFPSSSDPVDSYDPIQNIIMMLTESSAEELILTFDQISNHAVFNRSASFKFHQDLLLNFMIFNVILDSAHLIYVRTYKHSKSF